MGYDMNESLSNTIQSEEAGVRVDVRPKYYYNDDNQAQTITFPNGNLFVMMVPYHSYQSGGPHQIKLKTTGFYSSLPGMIGTLTIFSIVGLLSAQVSFQTFPQYILIQSHMN